MATVPAESKRPGCGRPGAGWPSVRRKLSTCQCAAGLDEAEIRRIRLFSLSFAREPVVNDAPTPSTFDTLSRAADPACSSHIVDEERRHAQAKVAHELRTPLAAIVSLAEVMAGEHLGPLPNAQYKDYARSIAETARHTLEVIRGMLESGHACSDVAGQTLTELDLDRIAAEAVRAAGPMAAAAGLIIRLVPAERLPRVIADGVAVRQILLNLITNAIRYAGTGATLALRTGSGGKGEVWLEAEDDGPGFPVHVLQGVAHSVEAPGVNGEGGAETRVRYGLSLVRSLAEANGARMVLANGAHSGACIRIVFDPSRSVIV